MSRFAGEVGGHAWRYKTPVLLVEALGRVLMIRDGRIRGLSVLTVAAAIYFGALYWLDLTCFGPYYFENLNSIPRFSSVIVQPVHAVWLLALCKWLIWCSGQAEARLPAVAKAATAGAFAAVLVLAAVQARQLVRTMEDVTSHKYQNVYPGIS
ncbi:MAG: hypothetical protein VW547_14525 [Alphaproteobacteria bacterium]